MNRIANLGLLLALSLLPSLASAATPAIGVPQQIRQGVFADVNMGGFFTTGGQKGVSNLQAYLQLGVGYDISRNFALGASFGLGASAANCFGQLAASGACVEQDNPKAEVADNFTVTMFAGEASYRHYFNERLSLQPRLHLGYALLDPNPRFADEKAAGGPLAGASLGVEYATRMDHFSIGADVVGRLVFGSNIMTVAIYPKIKYTF